MKAMFAAFFVLALLAVAYAQYGSGNYGYASGNDDGRGSMMSAKANENGDDNGLGRMMGGRWDDNNETAQNETEIEDKCGGEDSMRSRMMCRENKTMDMMRGANASAGNFSMANVCKELNGTEQVSCMARYRTINKCPFLPTMRATEACIRNQLKISENIREHVRECDSEGENASSCRANLTDKVDTLVLARFEALKERAARLQEKGANETIVLAFIADVDGKVAAYEVASTADEKKQIVRDVAALWREFVKTAVQQIHAANPNVEESS